ncbi:MAG: hypothetical protein ABEL76_03140, partial [Bradymonadaceae bacterium]
REAELQEIGERPERLTYRQKQLYKGALEDRASQVEKKAVSAYERALKVAKEQSWFNEYSRKAEIELANLRPKKYRKPSEWSAAPDHLEPGFARADFVEKLKEKEGRLEQLGGSSGGGESSEGGSEASESTSGQSDPRARRRSSTARAAAR